jgi:hypothetical protein
MLLGGQGCSIWRFSRQVARPRPSVRCSTATQLSPGWAGTSPCPHSAFQSSRLLSFRQPLGVSFSHETLQDLICRRALGDREPLLAQLGQFIGAIGDAQIHGPVLHGFTAHIPNPFLSTRIVVLEEQPPVPVTERLGNLLGNAVSRHVCKRTLSNTDHRASPSYSQEQNGAAELPSVC